MDEEEEAGEEAQAAQRDGWYGHKEEDAVETKVGQVGLAPILNAVSQCVDSWCRGTPLLGRGRHSWWLPTQRRRMRRTNKRLSNRHGFGD